MIARRIVAVMAALLLAMQVIRQGVIDSVAGEDPASAARLWPSHPDVQLGLGMTQIASAARQGRSVTPQLLTQIYDAGSKAPLAPEPYLVRGVQAQLAADQATAARAFAAAKSRNARSLPARYFLADHYLRQGDASAGLREIAVLMRLAPRGVRSLAPYLAAYARQPPTWPHLRALFRAEPVLEDATLLALAGDASNVPAVLAMATRRSADSVWLPPLVASLIGAGRHAEARRLWADVSGLPRDRLQLVHDGDFSDAKAPPPFNWTLTSSSVGLAERQRGGGLHVIYHGREDGALASQLILLPPGQYRLASPASGSGSRAAGLRWQLWCVTSNKEIALRALKDMPPEGWTFQIPSGCGAQRLELFGSSSDMPQATELTIRSIRLTREGPNG